MVDAKRYYGGLLLVPKIRENFVSSGRKSTTAVAVHFQVGG